jgi:pimeloyl-ACP methyl ester carboxylesterase
MIDDTNGCIDYHEAGDGPTVVFVPGSCSTGAAWRPVISELSDSFRCVTTSLLGYGCDHAGQSPGLAKRVWLPADAGRARGG